MLTVLDLSNNQLGPAAGVALGAMLTKNKHLRSLEIRHNTLGDEGLEAIAASLAHNNVLVDLGLEANKLTGCAVLVDVLSSTNRTLVGLRLQSNPKFSDKIKKALKKLAKERTPKLDLVI